MKRISNYHSHISLCGHAQGNVEEYVKEAIKCGYEEIGISDHAPIPWEWVGKKAHQELWLSQMMNYNQFKYDYLEQLNYCIKKYKDIRILKGLEIEYVAGHIDYYQDLKSNLDYFNLGIHYFFYKGQLINTYLPMNDNELDGYALIIEEALATGLFSCLVHPDLYLYNRSGFNVKEKEIARRIIEAAIKNNAYLEINANGKGKYPYPEFWKIVKEYDYPNIIIGSDAHYIKDFHGKQVAETLDFAKSLKINIADKMLCK